MDIIMKPKIRSNVGRFGSPTELKGDTPFLGATVEEWDVAITGDMEKSLAQVKARAMAKAPKRNVADTTAFDLASSVGKHLAGAK